MKYLCDLSVTMTIFLAFHNCFMILVHMEVHSKGYFLMRIQSKFEAWCKVPNKRRPMFIKFWVGSHFYVLIDKSSLINLGKIFFEEICGTKKSKMLECMCYKVRRKFPGSFLTWGPLLIILANFFRVYAYLGVYAC